MATVSHTPVNGTPGPVLAQPNDPPEPPRRGRGRPPGARTRNRTAAATTAEDIDDQVENSDEIEAAQAQGTGKPPEQDFWSWLSSFTLDDWNAGLLAYVYRTAPTIDRRTIGKVNYITKYGEPFDMDTIKRHFGSGGYRIDVNRRNGNNNQNWRIAQEYVTIMDLDFPPKVAAGEWIDQPENEMWLWAKPSLERQQSERVATGDGGVVQTVLNHLDKVRPNDSTNSSLAVEMQRTMSEMQKQMIAMSDPAKQLKVVLELMEKLSPPKPTGVDPFMQMLIDDRKAAREEAAELRKMLMERSNPAPQKDLLTQVTELMPVIDKFTKLVGKGAAPAAGTEEQGGMMGLGLKVLEKLSDHVPDLISAWRAASMAGEIRAKADLAKTATPNAGIQLAPRNMPAAAATPAASPDAEAQQTAEAAAAATQGDDTIMPTAEQTKILEQFGPLIQDVAPFLMDQFRNDMTGYDFADWFINRKGRDNYNLFRDGTGPIVLADLAQTHPILKIALSPKEKLVDFLTEFFTPPEERPEIEDEE